MKKSRKLMIQSIKRLTGCEGDWGNWEDKDVEKLYVVLKVGGPDYFESADEGEE